MKRPFSIEDLDSKIAERWPGIGDSLRRSFVWNLYHAKGFPESCTLDHLVFSTPDAQMPSEHLLLLLARYLFVPWRNAPPVSLPTNIIIYGKGNKPVVSPYKLVVKA